MEQVAIKTASYLAHRGQFQRSVLFETLATLVQPEWHALLPAFVRFCSFLLAACFQDLTKSALALRYIPIAVDCLGLLVAAKTAVHEEVRLGSLVRSQGTAARIRRPYRLTDQARCCRCC